MELRQVKLTKRQIVLRYARMHGLRAHGSDRKGLVCVGDGSRKAHWSEAWTLPSCETWAEAHALLKEIEDKYIDTLVPRPWETARLSYTGQRKPQPPCTF